jgi:hypothetical protein
MAVMLVILALAAVAGVIGTVYVTATDRRFGLPPMSHENSVFETSKAVRKA